MGLVFSSTFSAVGVSRPTGVKAGDAILYSVDLSNDFDGKLFLRFTSDGQTYEMTRVTGDVTDVQVEVRRDGVYDFQCVLGDGEVSLTGTATVSIKSVDKVLFEVKDLTGDPKFQVTEGGIITFGNQTSTEVGTPNGTTVTAVERGVGVFHQTVLTLVDTPVSIVSVTTGNGVGGTKIYDFPQGHIKFWGCVASLSIRVPTASQADFTDATPEGDIGIGTVAPADADALGADATDDNLATATAFTMSSYVDSSVNLPPDGTILLDGTSSAIDAFLNVLVDAADIDDGVTTQVLVSGTVTLTWTLLGNY